MIFNPDLTHERALLGAVDSYLGELVHVRPFLAQHYREICENMAEEWLENGGRNAIDALTPEWLSHYVVRQTDSVAAAEVLSSFCSWAVDQGLIVESPFQSGTHEHMSAQISR